MFIDADSLENFNNGQLVINASVTSFGEEINPADNFLAIQIKVVSVSSIEAVG